ncbi:hypothetical protein [Limibacillus halophilus]
MDNTDTDATNDTASQTLTIYEENEVTVRPIPDDGFSYFVPSEQQATFAVEVTALVDTGLVDYSWSVDCPTLDESWSYFFIDGSINTDQGPPVNIPGPWNLVSDDGQIEGGTTGPTLTWTAPRNGPGDPEDYLDFFANADCGVTVDVTTGDGLEVTGYTRFTVLPEGFDEAASSGKSGTIVGSTLPVAASVPVGNVIGAFVSISADQNTDLLGCEITAPADPRYNQDYLLYSQTTGLELVNQRNEPFPVPGSVAAGPSAGQFAYIQFEALETFQSLSLPITISCENGTLAALPVDLLGFTFTSTETPEPGHTFAMFPSASNTVNLPANGSNFEWFANTQNYASAGDVEFVLTHQMTSASPRDELPVDIAMCAYRSGEPACQIPAYNPGVSDRVTVSVGDSPEVWNFRLRARATGCIRRDPLNNRLFLIAREPGTENLYGATSSDVIRVGDNNCP